MEICDRCGEEGEDRRTLWHACFYAMEETGIPFEQQQLLTVSEEAVREIAKEKPSTVRFYNHATQCYEEQSGIYSFTERITKARHKVTPRNFYILRVCKACRAEWMQTIKQWFDKTKEQAQDTGTGVFIRELGNRRELTAEEVNQWRQE